MHIDKRVNSYLNYLSDCDNGLSCEDAKENFIDFLSINGIMARENEIYSLIGIVSEIGSLYTEQILNKLIEKFETHSISLELFSNNCESSHNTKVTFEFEDLSITVYMLVVPTPQSIHNKHGIYIINTEYT